MTEANEEDLILGAYRSIKRVQNRERASRIFRTIFINRCFDILKVIKSGVVLSAMALRYILAFLCLSVVGALLDDRDWGRAVGFIESDE